MDDEVLKKVTSAFSVPEGSVLPEDPELPIVETPAEPAPGFVPSPVWGVLKEKLGVEPPQELSAENELKIISETLEKVQPQKVNLHPMAMELNQKLADPEFKFDEWVSEKNSAQQILSLKGKEFFEKILPVEYPDASAEDISEMIEEMEAAGRMKVQELQMKRDIKVRQQQSQVDYQNQMIQQQAEMIRQANEVTEKELNQLFGETKNLTEIYGIPVSEAEKESFNKTFAELARRNDKGEMPLMNLLQSNQDLWKFAYITLYGNESFKKALFEAKEGTKADVLNKLRVTPTPGPGTPAGRTGPTKPDYSRLKQPQR